MKKNLNIRAITFPSLILLYFFTFAGCSSSQKKASYSRSTKNIFNQIERARLLNHYRELRKNGNPRPKYRPARRPKPRRRSVMTTSQRQAVERELNQNLSYFCMRHRKSSRFDDRDECDTYVRNVLEKCRSKIDLNNGRKLMRCLKRNLKN